MPFWEHYWTHAGEWAQSGSPAAHPEPGFIGGLWTPSPYPFSTGENFPLPLLGLLKTKWLLFFPSLCLPVPGTLEVASGEHLGTEGAAGSQEPGSRVRRAMATLGSQASTEVRSIRFFFSFFFFLSDKYHIYLRCTRQCFDVHIYCKMTTTIKLINIHCLP